MKNIGEREKFEWPLPWIKKTNVLRVCRGTELTNASGENDKRRH